MFQQPHPQFSRNTLQQQQHGVNDNSMLPENEVVFRAVSPHGHVYWEIDPKKMGLEGHQGQQQQQQQLLQQLASQQQQQLTSDEEQQQMSSNSDMSSRQSSSRYSDNHPLITYSSSCSSTPQHQLTNGHVTNQVGSPSHVLVNPFADVHMLPASVCSSPTAGLGVGRRPSGGGSGADFRFSSLRIGGGNGGSGAGGKKRNPGQMFRTGKNKGREEIRDLRSNVKANEYIMSQIQGHIQRGSPADLALVNGSGGNPDGYHTAAYLDSPRQRKV